MVETVILLGRYNLDSEIASGGMGSVFAATDTRLGRKVAVKLLRRELAENPSFVERFRREARSAAALSHPNIANVYDYGEDSGKHFIVMELVTGKDLARVLREDGPLTVERTVRIATQLCGALGHAHAAGVVHRDIKPANVILGPDDSVKVTDFGIARAVGHTTLTATGSVMGSAHYISPEQAEGRDVGPASDLYSAGIVIYEMLTGTLPFTGDSPIAVAMRQVSDDVPPPSELNPDVPPELDAVVARATAKPVASRFPDSAAMAAALDEALQPTAPEGVPAPTAVLGGLTPTRPIEDENRLLPITHGRDAQRLGAIVLTIFAVLVVAALAFLVARVLLADNEPENRARQRSTVPPAAQTQSPASPTSPSPTPTGFVIPNEIVGIDVKDAEKLLRDNGIETDTQEVESDDPEDVVVGTSPEPGTTVAPGETVTLFVSLGPEEEEDDNGPPDEPPGKGKGRGEEDD